MIREEELRERSRRAMEEALHQQEELEWKASYFEKQQDVVYCAWRAEQEKLRFLVWKEFVREKKQLVEERKENFDSDTYGMIYCPDYYRSNYPEAARKHGNTEKDLFDYFMSKGIRKGDQGCIRFNVWSYRKWNPDLDALWGDDLEKYYRHYINEGYYQKRRAFGMPEVKEQTIYNGVDYEPVYQFYDYLYYNPDVLENFGLDPDLVLKHFVEHGMDELRRSKKDFYVIQYRRQYDDLRAAFGDQYRKYYEHYLREGRKEGRRGVYWGSVK